MRKCMRKVMEDNRWICYDVSDKSQGGGFMNLGEKLYKLRKETGLSQEALAEQMKTSRQAISKWENNRCV